MNDPNSSGSAHGSEPETAPDRKWFELQWERREEVVYRQCFGELGEGVYTPPADLYQNMFRHDPHPGWLNHGVFVSPPGDDRDSWLYATSGLSNPWNLEEESTDPTGFSGLGFELTFELPSMQPWAVALLHNLMAYQQLVAVGKYPGAELLEYGNRVPLQRSLRPADSDEGPSDITCLLVTRPAAFAESFELRAGRVDFYQLFGITEAEREFAKKESGDALEDLLRRHTAYPVTDPDRKSVLLS